MTENSRYKPPEMKSAIDAVSIDGPRADGFERSPIEGMDIRDFRNWLARALSGDPDVPPSVLSRVNEAAREHGAEAKKRDMKWWETYFWFQAAQESLRRLRELIETKCAERDQLVADIREDERLLKLFGRHGEGEERAENHRELHGAYELNEFNELADADAEDMLKAWEKRAGRRLDRSDTKAVLDAFRDQKQFEEAEGRRIERELPAKRERVKKLNLEIEELETEEKNATKALENGGDPKAIDSEIQRQLIAKGHGTDEQKQRLAEEQGIALSKTQAVAQMNDDEFGEPSIKPSFNQTASIVQPKPVEPAVENDGQEASPIKQPAMNING